MRQKVKRIEKLVKLLKEGEPRWVSLVDHGANQTPFLEVKMADGSVRRVHRITHMPRKTAGEPDMKTSNQKRAKASSVRKLVFSQEHFASEADVRKWLKKNNWAEGYEVKEAEEAGEDVFVAEDKGATDTDFVKGSIRAVKVEGSKGVTGFVGELKAVENADDDDDAEDTTKASKPKTKGKKGDSGSACLTAKAAGLDKETTAKFDSWYAYMSDGKTLEDVLEDGMKDGTPPGFYDVMFATQKAIGNVLKDEEADVASDVKSIADEMADIVVGLHALFVKIVDENSAKKLAKKHADGAKHLEALSAWATEWKRESTLASADDTSGALKGAIMTTKNGAPQTDAEKKAAADKEAADKAAADKAAAEKAEADAKAKKEAEDKAAKEAADKAAALQTSASAGDFGAIAKSVSELAGSVATLATSVAKQGEALDGLVKKVDDATTLAKEASTKAEAVAKRAPTKKAANTDAGDEEGDEGEEGLDKEAKADRDFERKLNRRAFGG
jgi:hypothetical protein